MERGTLSVSSTEGGAGAGWCELHAHSCYSLLDGASRPADLAACAAALGYPALALTDHDSLAGLVAHATACQVAGIRPIAGCELTLVDGDHPAHSGHLTVLARDAVGYRSLARLVSTARLAGPKGAPGATLADLASCAAGLECLSGCRRGAVPTALLAGDEARAHVALSALCDIFGAAHTWVEVQRPGLPDDAHLSFDLARLARRVGVGLVATGNAHYAHPEDRPLQDVLVCIRERVPLTRALPHLRPGGAWSLRSPAEMARRFADLPAALRGAAEVASRCGFDLGHVDARLPAFPVPPGQTADSHLRHLALSGAREHYGDAATTGVVRERLEHELAVIAHLDLADYILIVHDIVQYARGQGILGQGRGSSVGSAVCYCLGITAVEPLAHHLSFARFLDPARADPPDIDVDFPSDRDADHAGREAVIQYVLARWEGHAALVATAITFRARSAIRDVGMALGLSPTQIDLLAKECDRDTGVADMMDGTDVTDSACRANTAGDVIADAAATPVLRRLRDLCARLDGLPRHLGQHPGGLVVTRRPLAEVAPLEPAHMADRVIVQWDKDAAEDAGLAKIDILGLGMLTAIDRCFALVAQETGARPALHGFRCDDPRVYDAFCRSDTVGVFQLESRAQMTACLPALQPQRYEDLIAAVVLIRPGPLQGNATRPFLRRRQGLEPVHYPGGAAGRRLLEPILGETYGVILYQDQCIDVARACGLDAGEAAALRRAMSSARDPARMAALGDRLDRGLAAQGLDTAARAAVLTAVQAFAGYGFVKGHSAAFAYLAYVSCWLKVYHPAAFCAALLNAQPMGFYTPEVVIQDAARHGVRVLPVDLRHSRADCTLEHGAVRLGWRLVRGLGPDAGARLEGALDGGPFPEDLDALCLRARLEEDEAVALARAGALRCYALDRHQAQWQVRAGARAARERWLPGLRAVIDRPVTLPPVTANDELRLDLRALGLTPGRHMLEALRPSLAHRPLCRATDLVEVRAGAGVEVVGQAISRQHPGTAQGVVFLTLSDETGLINAVVRPPVYARDRVTIRGEALLWLGGVVERRDGAVTLRVVWARPLAVALAREERG